MSLSDAIKAAQKWLKAKGFNSDNAFFLEDIQLKTPLADGMQNKWFYIFSYDFPPATASEVPRSIRVVVLMNGKIVDVKGN